MKNSLITHLSIYKIEANRVFDNVNSYAEMTQAIISYGMTQDIAVDWENVLFSNEYKNRVGAAFEIYTQFFCNRYGDTPLLGILEVTDTSDDPYTYGYDYLFRSLDNKPGQLQSKFRSDPFASFKMGKLSTMGDVANAYNIEKNNCILFINIDDHENLFDYRYKFARNSKRIVDRKMQEEFILNDPKFWDEFRENIKESAKIKFEDAPPLRDVQEWSRDGHTRTDDGMTYSGTKVVVNGELDKGRVEGACALGKTLSIYTRISWILLFWEKN